MQVTPGVVGKPGRRGRAAQPRFAFRVAHCAPPSSYTTLTGQGLPLSPTRLFGLVNPRRNTINVVVKNRRLRRSSAHRTHEHPSSPPQQPPKCFPTRPIPKNYACKAHLAFSPQSLSWTPPKPSNELDVLQDGIEARVETPSAVGQRKRRGYLHKK